MSCYYSTIRMILIITTVGMLTILAWYTLQWHSTDKWDYSLITLFKKKLIPIMNNAFAPWSISVVPRRNHLVNASSLLQFPIIQGSWDANICEISNGFFMPMESKKKKKNVLLWWCFQMFLMLHIWQGPFFSNKLRFSRNHTRQLKCDRPWNLSIDGLYLKSIYISDNQCNYSNTYMQAFTQS